MNVWNGLRPRGMSLLEVLVAMAVLGIGFGVILQLTSTALSGGILTERYTEAETLARNKLDELLEPDRAATPGGGDFPGHPGFLWKIEVREGPGPQTQRVVVVVSFRAPGGERYVTLESFKAVRTYPEANP